MAATSISCDLWPEGGEPPVSFCIHNSHSVNPFRSLDYATPKKTQTQTKPQPQTYSTNMEDKEPTRFRSTEGKQTIVADGTTQWG